MDQGWIGVYGTSILTNSVHALKMEGCIDRVVDNEPTTVMSENNIWRFVQTDTNMKILCNGELVVDLTFKDVGDACYDRWGGGNSVTDLAFNGEHDTASVEWRTACESNIPITVSR
eukprot:sb/3476667/